MKLNLHLLTIISLPATSFGFISNSLIPLHTKHIHPLSTKNIFRSISNWDDAEVSSEIDENNFLQSCKNRRSFLSKLVSTTASAAISTLTLPQTSLAASASPKTSVSAVTEILPTPPFTKDVSWPLGKVAFSLLPLAGTSTRRATVEEEIVPGQIWTHDQIQGVVNVNVPVRQTVIKVSSILICEIILGSIRHFLMLKISSFFHSSQKKQVEGFGYTILSRLHHSFLKWYENLKKNMVPYDTLY